MKNSNDTTGMEPATFRLVKQCLNKLCLRVLEKRHQLLFWEQSYIRVPTVFQDGGEQTGSLSY